jgi:hypothetical protein
MPRSRWMKRAGSLSDFHEPRLMDVEQHEYSSAGFTTRVNMLAPFFG